MRASRRLRLENSIGANLACIDRSQIRELLHRSTDRPASLCSNAWRQPPPQRRRGRLHRLLRRLHAQRNSNKTSALVGLWDECIADERIPELGGAALLYWTRHGGDRTVAKSSWLPRGASPRSPLEALAYGVLRAHTPDETPEDAVAGAEYWVQIRGGNGEACGIRNGQSNEKGLGLHFDKDERAHAERGEWRHPLLATATYSHGRRRAARRLRHDIGWQRPRLAGLARRPANGAPRGLSRGSTPRRSGRACAGEPPRNRINCAKDDPGTTRISVLVNLWDRKPVGVSRAAPYRGSTLPIDVNFAQPVAPPIEVVQPDDHRLAEHRDGDTLPIPITAAMRLAGGIPGCSSSGAAAVV